MALTAGSSLLFPVLRQCRLALIEPRELVHAVLVRILRGENGRAARRADGVGAEDVAEEHTVARQTIEVRRRVELGKMTTVRTDGLGRVVVRHDEEEVGMFPME